MADVSINDTAFEYDEVGSGEAVVLVRGSALTAIVRRAPTTPAPRRRIDLRAPPDHR